MNSGRNYYILLFFTALTIISCDVSTPESKQPSAETSLSQDREAIDMISGRLLQPGLVSSRLEETGTDFDWSFLQLKNYPRPEKDTSRAILSGMLTADVSYFITFDQDEFERPYFERLNALSGDMCRIERGELESLNLAFEENSERRDSLMRIVNSIYDRTTRSLQSGNQNDLAILYVVSHVLENLYISASLIDNYPEDLLAEDSRSIIIVPLVRALLEQEANLEDAILLLEQSPDKTNFGMEMIQELEIMDNNFDLLSIEESLRERRADLVMSDTTFKALRVKIDESRNRMFLKIE